MIRAFPLMPISQIACLGPEGTFSHLLARQRFGSRAELTPCDDLGRVFTILEEDANALAVVPIENSSGGTITETIDLLIQSQDRVRVLEDLTLDVRLALLGHTGKKIREIYSHFAPLRHHREWLLSEFPGVRLTPVSSTAVAARKASERQSAAALASPGVARLLPLDVLRFPIRPREINITRFYIVGPQGARLTGKTTPPSQTGSSPSIRTKTALTVQLKNQCGSLHAFLGSFARSGINLRMIVSRPVPGHPETYVFYLEVEGDAAEAPLREVLRRAGRHCLTLDPLGTFPVGKRYQS